MITRAAQTSNPILLRSDRKDETVLDFAKSVARGLSDAPRWLDCRYLYDARGSEIYERITEQPEYYPTRTEADILATHVQDISETTGPVTLIELGSGSSVKSEHILRAYLACNDTICYAPVDISESMLLHASEKIVDKYPQARVIGVSACFEEAFPLIKEFSPSMTIFLGSSIGNMDGAQSLGFWESVTKYLPAGDFFLLGVDLEKEVAVLEAAYNDAAGFSSAFTKNLLERMNRELGSDIDTRHVEHVARYNRSWQRVEIQARFTKAQTISLEPLGLSFDMAAGEMVMTEVSRKYRLEPLKSYLAAFGLRTLRIYTDPKQWFALLLLQMDPVGGVAPVGESKLSLVKPATP